MEPAEMFGAAMGRIWASQRIVEDLAALCACGGRFWHRERSAGAGISRRPNGGGNGCVGSPWPGPLSWMDPEPSIHRPAGWSQPPGARFGAGQCAPDRLNSARITDIPTRGYSNSRDALRHGLRLNDIAGRRRRWFGRYPRCSWHEDSRFEHGLGVKPAWRSC